MSDDFGTVNVNRAERAREIEAVRQRYARHRDAVQKLAADAPNERLASEYRRILGEIDAAMLKLDQLGPSDDLGLRPLVTSPAAVEVEDAPRDSRLPLVLIAVAAVVAIAVIGWLVFKPGTDGVAEQPQTATGTTTATTTTTTTAAPATIVEEPPATVAEVLTVSPATHDYGVIRKGTRATRQFEVRNDSEEPVSISVARSLCRCLFYEYNEAVPPKGKETVTVTVDGARAKAGELRETVKITSKRDPGTGTSFTITANVR